MLGDTYVGKTSILNRFMKEDFNELTSVSVALDIRPREVAYNDVGDTVKLNVWDTAGNERYQAMNKGYFRGAHAAIIVYDYTKRKSF